MNIFMGRPSLRSAFLVNDKRLDVYFYTSNIAKYLHARTVFDRSGLNLRHFRSKTDPYSEDYSVGRRQLLFRAIREITQSFGRTSLLFVEDTSLRIDALSSGENDFPGLAVKEWFASTTFEQVDEEIKKRGNCRTAVVRSDIALNVPGLSAPLFFVGETRGNVAESPPEFEESPSYPWLTPQTFNGWFVPQGSSKRLGEMSLEESWPFDFRTRALTSLIDRLEEYAAILNLPHSSYSRRPSQVPSEGHQQSLLPEGATCFIVVGRTCAGKTTFGERASQAGGIRFVEASSILRMFASEIDGSPARDSLELAQRLLVKNGPDFVALKLLQLFSSDLRQGKGIAVTGFRTIEELEFIKSQVPTARVVFVEASERTRFQRHVQRGRPDAVRSLADFRKLDMGQDQFGLLKVAEDFADVRVTNEGSLKEYLANVDTVIIGRGLDDKGGISTAVHPRHASERSQLYKCLRSLSEAGRPLTCEEIELRTGKYGLRVRHNNANKVLKRVPALAQRLEVERTRIRYEILNPGRAYIKYMDGWVEKGKQIAGN